jgi:hypothetical protein
MDVLYCYKRDYQRLVAKGKTQESGTRGLYEKDNYDLKCHGQNRDNAG